MLDMWDLARLCVFVQIDTRSYMEWFIYMYGWYEEPSVKLLQMIAHPGSIVFDVGANIGSYTLPLARTVGVTGMVYAFEPHPRVCKRLTANIALNNLLKI